MVTSPAIRTALLTLSLFAGVTYVSARTSETAISTRSGTAMQFRASASANHLEGILMLWDGHDGDDDRDSDRDKDREKDRDKSKGDKDKDDRAPSPSPEPSTLLSFGAAALIGAAVLYSRRLLGNRN
jgi:hypothetical protein